MNKKILVFFFVILLLLTCVVIFWENYNREKNTTEEGVRIVVYQDGKSEKINPETVHFKEFQEKCESLFINADDALSLIVTKKVISQAKENTAVEIFYSKSKEFTINPVNPHIKKVDALLISFINNSATIYYSIGGSYSSGPLVNKNTDEIEKCRDIFLRI